MIVGEQKPIDENWKMIKDYKRVLVFGCNTCVAICHAGGIKQAETLASLLRMKAIEEGVDMQIDSLGVERHCEPEFFEAVMEDVKSYDLVLSLACGVGVNMLSELIGNMPVFPGLDTEFFGAVPKAGVFEELCAGCGHCILDQTGGICPIARCAKSLMNGPCGGTNNGKCEISDEVDCAWHQIVQRMKDLGTLEKLYEVQPPRDWSGGTHGGPRRVVLEHIKEDDGNEDKSE